jgi:hypothetical protein
MHRFLRAAYVLCLTISKFETEYEVYLLVCQLQIMHHLSQARDSWSHASQFESVFVTKYFSSDKARRIRLAGEREEMHVGFRWGKHERKRPLGRFGLRWEDNIECYLR